MGQVVTLENFRPPDRFDTVPWATARIEEAEAETGPYTVIDTQDIDPVDADPTAPALRSFTTSEGTDVDLWYRIVFLDDSGGVSNPSAAVQNTSATGTALATPAELAARLGITFLDDEADRALTLLALASGLVRKEVGQTISLVTDDVLTIRGNYSRRIVLPQRPVVDVSAVTVNAVALDDSSWYLDGSELVRGSAFTSWGGWSYWGCPADTVEITYSHGYADVPDFVKATVLEAVARVWVNPAVTIRETNGSSEVAYAPANGLLLTGAERATVCDGLRLQARSVQLR